MRAQIQFDLAPAQLTVTGIICGVYPHHVVVKGAAIEETGRIEHLLGTTRRYLERLHLGYFLAACVALGIRLVKWGFILLFHDSRDHSLFYRLRWQLAPLEPRPAVRTHEAVKFHFEMFAPLALCRLN